MRVMHVYIHKPWTNIFVNKYGHTIYAYMHRYILLIQQDTLYN
jgi:hypothetical protein